MLLQRAQRQARAHRADERAAVVVRVAESDESDMESSDVETVVERTVHFMEVFSPPRVCFAVARHGLVAPPMLSLDLTTGYDFLTMEDRARCLRLMESERPQFIIVSPPCTMYSPLQQLFNLKKMAAAEKERRFQEADVMLNFSMSLCRLQQDKGRYFCFEHPFRASSWQRRSVQDIIALPSSFCVAFDQCRTGLVTPGESPEPIRKRTVLLSNAPAILQVFQPLQCTCPAGKHRAIEGSIDGISLSKWCQYYTPQLCTSFAHAVAATVHPHGG